LFELELKLAQEQKCGNRLGLWQVEQPLELLCTGQKKASCSVIQWDVGSKTTYSPWEIQWSPDKVPFFEK
jgi:hypothetical protein